MYRILPYRILVTRVLVTWVLVSGVLLSVSCGIFGLSADERGILASY